MRTRRWWWLCLSLSLVGCSGPMDLGGAGDPDNGQNNADPDNSNANEDPTGDATVLQVSLGEDLLVNPTDIIQIQAQVLNPADRGELYYLWEYVLDEGGLVVSRAQSSSEHLKDWNAVSVQPQDLFPGITLDGRRIRIKAHVLELRGTQVREGLGEKRLNIRGQEQDNDNGDSANGNDNDPPNSNDNGDDNSNDNAGDNENDNQDANDNQNLNDNDNGVDPIVIPGGGGGGAPAEPDPCDGITNLTVLLPQAMQLSMFEGTARLEPVICGGAPPYAYDWSPTTYLAPPADLGGGGGGAIDTQDVQFTPDHTGTFDITLTVTDNDAAMVDATISITVNNYDPLVAQAPADQAAQQFAALNLGSVVLGGSGDFTYTWTPGSAQTATFFNVPTGQLGATTYTFTVVDMVTGHTASDLVKVVILAAGAACDDDHSLGVPSASFVAHDSGYGTAGQAVVIGDASVILFDLDTDAIRATLTLPASGRGLAVDAARRRAFVTTQLAGQFTRSVQIIDLDAATLGNNVGLGTEATVVGGLAVIPSTGQVLVTISGASPTDGVLAVNPDTAALSAAVQNLHHGNSFQQPLAVAVVEQGALATAVIANGGAANLTLVPLSAITYTPHDPTAGGQPALAKRALGGNPRALAADPANTRVIAAWNDGGLGAVQVLNLTGNQNGWVAASIPLDGSVLDQGLSVDSAAGHVYAASGNNDVALVDLNFDIQTATLQGSGSAAFSVAAPEGSGSVLIVGNNGNLAERCP